MKKMFSGLAYRKGERPQHVYEEYGYACPGHYVAYQPEPDVELYIGPSPKGGGAVGREDRLRDPVPQSLCGDELVGHEQHERKQDLEIEADRYYDSGDSQAAEALFG